MLAWYLIIFWITVSNSNNMFAIRIKKNVCNKNSKDVFNSDIQIELGFAFQLNKLTQKNDEVFDRI